MKIENQFELGQTVYLKTDEGQCARIVTAITVHPMNQLVYSLACSTDISDHYDFEITEDKTY